MEKDLISNYHFYLIVKVMVFGMGDFQYQDHEWRNTGKTNIKVYLLVY